MNEETGKPMEDEMETSFSVPDGVAEGKPPMGDGNPTVETIPPRRRSTYSAAEQMAAVFCLPLGYWLVRWVLPGGFGIGTALSVGAFWMLFAVCRRNAGQRFSGGDRFRAALLLVFTLPFLLFAKGLSLWLNMAFLTAATAYTVYLAGEGRREWWRRIWMVDTARSLFGRPFAAFGHAFGAAGSLFEHLPFRKGTKRIVGGLLLALPVTMIVGFLLMQADALFADMMEHAFVMFGNLFADLPAELLRLGLAVPFALYLFGMLYAGVHASSGLAECDEKWENGLTGIRCLSSGTLAAAMTPLCLLYLLFFATQSAYHLAAFQEYLPVGFTYATYARRGFFELCAVTIINLGVLALLYVLCRREGDRLPAVIRGYGAGLCLMTLLLIAVALRKMLLYIDRYGLTPLRIYTSWFMILLAVVFLLVGLSLLVPCLRASKAVVLAFVLWLGILQFANVDGLIARYNVTRYQAESLPTIDVSLFDSLSDAAVPYAAELLDDGDTSVARDAHAYLKRRWAELEDQPAAGWNVTSWKARCMLQELAEDGRLH